MAWKEKTVRAEPSKEWKKKGEHPLGQIDREEIFFFF